MTAGFAQAREAFTAAAQWFLDTVDQVGTRWEDPGLGEWDVRALVGHTSRSLLTVESYLGTPASTVDIPSTADYYRATREIAAGPGVAQRGRDAGAALGEDPARELAAIARRVLPLVEAQDGTALLTTIAGGMRLSDYLPTRTFELTVHTLDLASALGLPIDPPPMAAREAMQIVTDLAVDDGRAGVLLLAATGRPALPAGFSVLSD
jgi:uncharacterized protein (TIGR03083 family)